MTSEAKKDLAWKGNWLLRRKRLEVIDFELRKVKPDILAFQNVMNRMESPSESDINILSFGSLRGYSWKSAFIKNYAETGEDKFQSLAVSLPLRFQQVGNDVYSWPLGVDGFLSMYELFLVDRPILVFNVSMPKSTENVVRVTHPPVEIPQAETTDNIVTTVEETVDTTEDSVQETTVGDNVYDADTDDESDDESGADAEPAPSTTDVNNESENEGGNDSGGDRGVHTEGQGAPQGDLEQEGQEDEGAVLWERQEGQEVHPYAGLAGRDF